MFYERQAYLHVGGRMTSEQREQALAAKEREFRELILRAYKAEPLADASEQWTGGYLFENEWQSFRTRKNRELELTTARHTYDLPGRYTVAVKVIDIFGNDTMTLVPVDVG